MKGFNVEELDNYAKLVTIGNPDFIELKGVTYCGTSKGRIKDEYLKVYYLIIVAGLNHSPHQTRSPS